MRLQQELLKGSGDFKAEQNLTVSACRDGFELRIQVLGLTTANYPVFACICLWWQALLQLCLWLQSQCVLNKQCVTSKLLDQNMFWGRGKGLCFANGLFLSLFATGLANLTTRLMYKERCGKHEAKAALPYCG